MQQKNRNRRIMQTEKKESSSVRETVAAEKLNRTFIKWLCLDALYLIVPSHLFSFAPSHNQQWRRVSFPITPTLTSFRLKYLCCSLKRALTLVATMVHMRDLQHETCSMTSRRSEFKERKRCLLSTTSSRCQLVYFSYRNSSNSNVDRIMFIVDRILLYTSLAITSFTIPIYSIVVNTILSTRHKCSFDRTFFAIVAVNFTFI